MPPPPFISRPGQPEESICTKCFLTIRVTVDLHTMREAQAAHLCASIDLKTMTGRMQSR